MSDTETTIDGLPDDAVAIGDGHWVTFFRHVGPEGALKRAGLIAWHANELGRVCGGAVHWWRREGEQGPTWTLVSEEPLHVEPSIHCGLCGDHGWIHGGRWEAA